jgi:predicted Zn-dependent protease
MRYFLYVGYLYFIVACNFLDNDETKPSKPAKKMTYSYACLDSALSGNDAAKAISQTTGLIRNLAIKEKDITDSLQNDYGNAFHQDAIETKAFELLDDKAITGKLQQVMGKLLAARTNPSHINYSIYLLKSDEINAFTFGGHIYVTKAMYNRCKDNDALIFAIIGHEIGHSEKGHIKKTIQEMMITQNIFGEERGIEAFQVLKLLTGAFNQKNELEADYYGTDLAYTLDMDVCAAPLFWLEMSKKENQYSKLEDFFRTHPFSSLRYQCLKDHILSNFGKTCAK